MKNIQDKIIKCSLCGELPKLIENSIQCGNTKFIIIGESPAKDGWIESKRAFYNTSGKLQSTGRILERLLNNNFLALRHVLVLIQVFSLRSNRQAHSTTE